VLVIERVWKCFQIFDAFGLELLPGNDEVVRASGHSGMGDDSNGLLHLVFAGEPLGLSESPCQPEGMILSTSSVSRLGLSVERPSPLESRVAMSPRQKIFPAFRLKNTGRDGHEHSVRGSRDPAPSSPCRCGQDYAP
jgi:hypothetical protein